MFSSCSKESDPVSSEDEGLNSNSNTGTTVKDAASANSKDHESIDDYKWITSEVVSVQLNGNSIVENSDGATTNGGIITITSAGNYSFSGSLTNGQIIVDTQDEAIVRLVLNGVNINCSSSSPIYVKNAKKVLIVLADNTSNIVKDGSVYTFANSSETEPNAAIFSLADLTIFGNGSLDVTGNYNDAIASKDGLIIKSSTIKVTAKDDGIRGKDYLVIKGGTINVSASGDGLKTDNTEDKSKGYISIENGKITISSGLDCMDAETDVIISSGEFNLTSGGGSGKTVSGTTSAKAIKGIVSVVINNGNFNISSADDAIHSNVMVSIHNGRIDVSSGDDGIHADSVLTINDGIISITKSYEGIESAILTINNGTIHIISSDDGINGAGGNDGSGMNGWPGGLPTTEKFFLYINGGYIAVNANGDGIDINGSIVMTGGEVLVHGPTSNANGAIDYDGTFKITGGFLMAAGSSGMAQAPGTTSSQNSLLINFKTAQAANSIFHLQTSSGELIANFTPVKKYQSVAFSSPKIIKGTSYDIYLGGSSTGTNSDGLNSSGSYNAGTKSTTFTVSSVVTKLTI